MWRSGDLGGAAGLLEAERLAEDTSVYADGDEVLLELERGGVALAAGAFATAFEALNDAEELTELQVRTAGTRRIGQWAIGDRVSPYMPAAHERQYINVLKMIAHVGRQRVDTDLRIEGRRMATRANVLRDEYLDAVLATGDEGGEALEEQIARAPGWVRGRNRAGTFVESPAGIYLTAIAARADGDMNTADVALRRLDDALRLHNELAETAQTWVFDDMGVDEPIPNLLAVATTGTGPDLERETFGPYFVAGLPVLFELPRIRRGGSEVARVWLEISAGPGQVRRLDMGRLEDVNVVMAENHRRALPLVYRRTALRALVKSGVVTIGGLAGGVASGRPSVGLAGVVGSLGVLALTERADTRAWVALPGSIWARSARIEPGEYAVRVLYEGAAGAVVHVGPWESLTISEHGIAGVVGRYRR